ncbi:hypothetical protein OIU84_022767 [Salix udensis]|uniref:VQ domain-containing protein n=1 Tax=Salix udensis TaxID=889485 RepID=A0AAD6KPT1_9ROSI|nr:hypothetical protein OIU84_022767 [Salix udensis]
MTRGLHLLLSILNSTAEYSARQNLRLQSKPPGVTLWLARRATGRNSMNKPIFMDRQRYPPLDSPGATSVATSGSSDIINPSSSITSSGGDQTLTPKGCGSKPIRRRSRASKKAPTTLLNASSANFRALVQQFTGCSSPPNSFGEPKGSDQLEFWTRECTESKLCDCRNGTF